MRSDNPDGNLSWSDGWPNLGMPAGYYLWHGVIPFGLIGGEFDGAGVWHPGEDALLAASVERTFSDGLFFVVDNTTSEGAQPGHLQLASAAWFSLTNSMNTIFFGIPEERSDNSFLLHATGYYPEEWNAWFPVSKGNVQMGMGSNGEMVSLGYFEGWTFIPSAVEMWRLIDVTTGEATGPGTSGVQLGGFQGTWGEGEATPTQEARVQVPYVGETFTWHAGDQQGSETSVDTGSGIFVIFSVGAGKDFWIERGSTEGTTYRMLLGGMEVDETARFTYPTYTPNWQTRWFRGADQSAMKVRRLSDNTETDITWNSTPNGQYIYDSAGNLAAWVEWYDGSASVDLNSPWSVFDGSNTDRGQGPDFFQWPTLTAPQTEVILPQSRFGHDLKTQYGDPVTYVGAYGHVQTGDYFTGEAFSFWAQRYTVTLPAAFPSGGGHIRLKDDTTNELSPEAFFTASSQVFLTDWHNKSPLLLRISATRWSNNLMVRSAAGNVYGITRHQVQGDWSWNPADSSAWFNSYGFFDADSMAEDLPWHLFDATRNEILTPGTGTQGFTDYTAATDNTDTDSDGLPDWYERVIGTNPGLADTDGDGTNDYAEVQAGTNPRAVSVDMLANSTLKVFTPLE